MPELVSEAVRGPAVPEFDANAHLKTQVTIPIFTKTLEGLRTRFGTRLDTSIAAILGCMLDPQAFIVPGFDVERIADHLGIRPKSSVELVGRIIEVVGKRNELQAAVDRMATAAKDGRGIPADGSITLKLPPAAEQYIREKAAFNGVSVEKMLEQTIQYAVEQKWF